MRKLRTYFCERCKSEFQSRRLQVRFCSISCRAKALNSVKNLLRDDGKPILFDDSKIRACLICAKQLHHCSKSGYCKLHYRQNSMWKERISASLRGKTGGLRPGSGHGKSGWYKGYWCDSTWELAWIDNALESELKFERNTKKFPYEWEGKIRNYTPDFDVGTHYIEVKGWVSEQALAKLNAKLDKPVVMLSKEIYPLLEKLKERYGKDLTVLYEKRAVSPRSDIPSKE